MNGGAIAGGGPPPLETQEKEIVNLATTNFLQGITERALQERKGVVDEINAKYHRGVPGENQSRWV